MIYINESELSIFIIITIFTIFIQVRMIRITCLINIKVKYRCYLQELSMILKKFEVLC